MTSRLPGVPRDYYRPTGDTGWHERVGFIEFIRRHWSPQGLVLDVGAGEGAVLAKVVHGTEATLAVALDHNKQLLTHHPVEVVPMCADCSSTLPFAAHTFDGVILSYILHLVREPKGLLSEIGRITRRGARVFVLTCSSSDLSNRILTPFVPQLLPYDLRRYPRIAKLKQTLASHGFSKVVIENVRLGTIRLDKSFPQRLSERRSGLQKLAAWIDEQSEAGRVLNVPWMRTAIAATRSA